MEGIYLIDKPEGLTSFDVIRKLRKTLHIKQIGHAGTLDPMATGLLICLVGRATKLSHLFLNKDKTYLATITFGFSTDSFDKTGHKVDEVNNFLLDKEQVETALLTIMKSDKQLPPMYSAIKKDGKKLYEYARKDMVVDLEERDIKISELEIIDIRKDSVDISITVSKGTYIRSIAHDIGKIIGIPSHLSQLRRIKSGTYDVKNADSLEADVKPYLSLNAYANTLDRVYVDDYLVHLVKNGIRLDERQTNIDGPFLVLDKAENPLAIYEKDMDNYKPILQLGG